MTELIQRQADYATPGKTAMEVRSKLMTCMQDEMRKRNPQFCVHQLSVMHPGCRVPQRAVQISCRAVF